MDHLQWIFPLKIVIFNSYVSLPEGNLTIPGFTCEKTSPLFHEIPRIRKQTGITMGFSSEVNLHILHISHVFPWYSLISLIWTITWKANIMENHRIWSISMIYPHHREFRWTIGQSSWYRFLSRIFHGFFPSAWYLSDFDSGGLNWSSRRCCTFSTTGMVCVFFFFLNRS